MARRKKKVAALEDPLRLAKGGECWLKGIGQSIHGPYLALRINGSSVIIARHYHSNNGRDTLSQLGVPVVVDERQLVLAMQKPLQFKGTQGYTDYRGQYVPPTNLEWFVNEYADKRLAVHGKILSLSGPYAKCLLSDRYQIS